MPASHDQVENTRHVREKSAAPCNGKLVNDQGCQPVRNIRPREYTRGDAIDDIRKSCIDDEFGFRVANICGKAPRGSVGVDSFNAVVPAFAILKTGFSDGKELRVGARELQLADGCRGVIAGPGKGSNTFERVGNLIGGRCAVGLQTAAQWIARSLRSRADVVHIVGICNSVQRPVQASAGIVDFDCVFGRQLAFHAK